MAAAPAGAPKAVPIHVTVSVPQEAPVHAPHPHAAGPQAPQAHDYCYGCRKFYTAVTRALGATKILTAVAAAVPMAYLLAVIIGVSTAVESTAALLKVRDRRHPRSRSGWPPPTTIAHLHTIMYRLLLQPTMAVLTSLTFVFGILAWIAIWAGTQNILAISVWAYYAIGNWALVSIVILVLAGW